MSLEIVMEKNPFPLQLRLVKAVEPKTSLEHEMHKEVEDLRNQEESDAVRRMRQNHKRYVKHVSNSMNDHAKELLDSVKEHEQEFANKIGKEERKEDQMGIKNHNDAHEKNHGITRHTKDLLNTVRSKREEEKEERRNEMNNWYKEKERHAVESMRDNEDKDLDQIVRLTRRLEGETKKSVVEDTSENRLAKKKDKKPKPALYVNGMLFYKR